MLDKFDIFIIDHVRKLLYMLPYSGTCVFGVTVGEYAYAFTLLTIAGEAFSSYMRKKVQR